MKITVWKIDERDLKWDVNVIVKCFDWGFIWDLKVVN